MAVDSAAETTTIAAANSSANWTVNRALRDVKRGMSVAAHDVDRRGPEPHLHVGGFLAGCDPARQGPARGAHISMPDTEIAGCGGNVRPMGNPASIGLRGPGAIG